VTRTGRLIAWQDEVSYLVGLTTSLFFTYLFIVMALPIPEFAVRQFETQWNHVVQQEVSRLRNRVTTDSFQGKEKVYKDLSTLVWSERFGRLGNSLPQEVEGYKRKLMKRDFFCQVIFDRKDRDYLVDELTRPGSETEMAMRMSWNRKVDELIATGISATVLGGPEPYVTDITLPGSQKVAVNFAKPGDTPANVGLTPWKLLEAKRILESHDIFLDGEGAEEVFIGISPKQEIELAAYVAASPNDVWAKMISSWMEGASKKLFGFNVVKSNKLLFDAGTDIRTLPVWSRSGVMVVPENMQIKVDELPEKQHAIQLSAYADYGVIRRYEERVVEIAVDESP